MRVITGSARGRKLKTPSGNDVRPTTDNVKEAIFNILRDDVEGRRVLDLFAGTGQLGIEALSRGAREAVFVDSSPESLKIVKENLALCRFSAAVVRSDAVSFLSRGGKYDVIFIDHMMPDMDGIETLKEIKKSGVNKDTFAVALTANAVSGARQMYLKAGFSDYLSKPVDGKKLEKMLYDMLDESKLLKPTDDKADDADESPVMDNVSSGLFDQFKDVDEIDVRAGLNYCGSEEGFLSVINVFHQTAGKKADEIEKLLTEGDIENYTVKVHALKSSARIIGATELSEFAKTLEDAGNNNDTGYILENTLKLLDMYRALDNKLVWLNKDDESLPMISESALKDAYRTIAEVADGMDYGLLEDIIKQLRGYRLPEEDSKRIGKIEALLNELDWDSIMATVSEINGGKQ